MLAHGEKLTPGSREEEITKNLMLYIQALQVELAEALQELNWKPWKKTKKSVSIDKLHEELIDCAHFMLELLIISGMDAKQIFSSYNKKMDINLNRQKQGY